MSQWNENQALPNATFIRFSKGELAGLPLPASSSTFLQNTGLPQVDEDLFIHFVPQVGGLRPRTYQGMQYVVIGNDYGNSVVVRVDDGQIFSVPEEGVDVPVRFVNTDIQSLARFVTIYLQALPHLRIVDDDEASRMVDRLEVQFNEVDPQALSDDENWWAVILEQVRYGLL
jgi:hypothetical protein